MAGSKLYGCGMGIGHGRRYGAKDQATRRDGEEGRELAEAAASEEARIEAEGRGQAEAPSSCRGRSEGAGRLGYSSGGLCARSEFKERN